MELEENLKKSTYWAEEKTCHFFFMFHLKNPSWWRYQPFLLHGQRYLMSLKHSRVGGAFRIFVGGLFKDSRKSLAISRLENSETSMVNSPSQFY